MAKKIKSAGILAHRLTNPQNLPEVFLVQPGGPYTTDKTKWGIPKGHVEHYDNKIIDTAIREFKEEVGYDYKISKKELIDLGSIAQNKNKTIYIWALKLDLGDDYVVKSNTTTIERPKKSGNFIDIPEIQQGKYFSYKDAMEIIVPGQIPILMRFYNNIEIMRDYIKK